MESLLENILLTLANVICSLVNMFRCTDRRYRMDDSVVRGGFGPFPFRGRPRSVSSFGSARESGVKAASAHCGEWVPRSCRLPVLLPERAHPSWHCAVWEAPEDDYGEQLSRSPGHRAAESSRASAAAHPLDAACVTKPACVDVRTFDGESHCETGANH